MTDIAMPGSAATPNTRGKWATWALVAGLAVTGAAGYAGYSWWTNPSAGNIVTGDFFTIAPVDMILRVAKDGELQAVNNIDTICMVEGQNTITTLVKEGAFVHKGDVLVTIDSSTIQQKIEDTQLLLQGAESDFTTAKEMRDIQESQNAANLDAAQAALLLAQLDLKQYDEGTYPQSVANAKTDLEMARITLRNAEEDLTNTKSLYQRGFVTGADVEKSELAVTTAGNTVGKSSTALLVLEKYTHAQDEASKQNALAQAQKALVRTKLQNEANFAQKFADVLAKEQNLTVLKRRYARLQEQFAFCTIKAPADGLVVYASSTDRNAQQQLIEGATVRERQPLLRLPDTSNMKAVINVQESQVGQLKETQRASVTIAGQPAPLGATVSKISVLADSSQRWWNPDLRQYPVELTLDNTPPDLKPGMGVNAEIITQRLLGVNAVPLPAVYSAGADTYVFVRHGQGVTPTRIKLGATSETNAQVLDGVQEGDQVLVLQSGQGRDLLEKAGIKTTPTTRPGDSPRRKGGPKIGS